MNLDIVKKSSFLEKLDIIEKIILFIIVYLMCTREYNPHDEQFIIFLGIIIIIKQIYKKIYYKIDILNFVLITSWLIFVVLSFFKSKNIDINNKDIFAVAYQVKLFKYIFIDGFLFFYILSQINLTKNIKYKIISCINIFSLYLIFKGLNFSLENGFFVRGPIWRNPNHYAMIMGVFIIISFISFLYEKNIKAKILYFLLNFFQLFFMISIGQSRNVFVSILILYFISIVIYIMSKVSIKKFFYYSSIIIIIMFTLIFLIYFFNDKFNLRIFNISIEDILKDPRIFIWVIILEKENFHLISGKGFAYYYLNPYYLEKFNIALVHLHNDFFEIGITQGILSVICYFGIIFYNVFKLMKNYLNDKEIYELITILLLIYILLIGLFESSIYQKRVIQFVFFFLGISIEKIRNNYMKGN